MIENQAVLTGKRILITGATSFIGARLAERLVREEQAMVTGTGRRLDRVSHLSTAGVNMQHDDLRDTNGMQRLLQGQEIVFHAAWLGREDGATTETHMDNVAISARLMRMMAEAGSRRLVFISSISAYGPPQRARVDEAHPVNSAQRDAYGRAKAAAEMALIELSAELGVEMVIIRPAMVYGPRSFTWTVRLLELVQKGVPVIFGRGDGNAFPVYIDNLVDGMMLAASREEAVGEAFNFCDQSVEWRVFFDYYGRMCGRRPRKLPLWAAWLLALASEKLKLGLPLTRDRLKFFQQFNEFPTDKAARLLGYEARVNLDDGMQQAADWLVEAGYIERQEHSSHTG